MIPAALPDSGQPIRLGIPRQLSLHTITSEAGFMLAKTTEAAKLLGLGEGRAVANY